MMIDQVLVSCSRRTLLIILPRTESVYASSSDLFLISQGIVGLCVHALVSMPVFTLNGTLHMMCIFCFNILLPWENGTSPNSVDLMLFQAQLISLILCNSGRLFRTEYASHKSSHEILHPSLKELQSCAMHAFVAQIIITLTQDISTLHGIACQFNSSA